MMLVVCESYGGCGRFGKPETNVGMHVCTGKFLCGFHISGMFGIPNICSSEFRG